MSSLFFLVASEQPMHMGAGDPISEGHWHDLSQDAPDQIHHHLLTSRAHALGLACRSFCTIRFFPDLRCILKFAATNNNEVLFQLPHVARWRQAALQAPPQMLQRTAGWDGCGPFLSEGM